MAAVKFMGYTILKSQAEKEIEDIFQMHEENLLTQKQKMTDEITEWANALIQSIHNNLKNEIYYLEQKYTEKVHRLNETRTQFIDDLRAREHRKDTDAIDQLLEQYKMLKYELAALEISVQTIPFIQVPYRKKSVTRGRVGYTDIKTQNAAFDNGATGENNYEIENNMDGPSTFYPDLSFRNTTQTNAQASPLNCANDSMNGDDDDPILDLNEDNSKKKCPVCYMIFPLTLTKFDRSRHIQEHYSDD